MAIRGIAPYAPMEELKHWVVSGLEQHEDCRWTWRLDPAFRGPTPPGRPARLIQPAEVMWRLLPQVRCPTLIVRGAASTMLPLDIADQVAAVMPNAHVVSIRDAGHWTGLDNPTGFVQAVRDFLTNP